MRKRIQWQRGRFYFGWNGEIYWFYIEFGRALSLTIGEKAGT